MRILNSGYPEGTDMSHFDGPDEAQTLKAKGVLGFGFKCSHCDGDIFVSFKDFEHDDALEYQCEHCDQPLSLEIC